MINTSTIFKDLSSYVYCIQCQKIFSGWKIFESCHDHGVEVGLEFPGVTVVNFLSSAEALSLVDGVDNILGWDASQSGRRKKNYGPKVNFKKKKLGLGQFKGFPSVTNFVRERLKNVPILNDFETVEECFLEYQTDRGSHIVPHIDDCWIW